MVLGLCNLPLVRYFFKIAEISENFPNSIRNDFRYYSNDKKNNDITFILALNCYDSQWRSMMGAAVIAILLYTIGIPVLFGVLVFKNKNLIRYKDLNFGDRYGAAFSIYSSNWFYWELLIFGRKLGMSIARSLVNPIFQCILGIIILFLSVQFQVIISFFFLIFIYFKGVCTSIWKYNK